MTGRRAASREEARRRAAARQRRNRATLLALGAGAVVVVAAAVAIIATQPPGPAASVPPGAASGQPAASIIVPTVAGGPLPRFESSQGDPAVGQAAPTVEGGDFEGRPVSIEADGRPKLAMFLAHWCPHCQREVPVIQGWLDQRGTPEGIDLVSVVTSNDPARPNYPPDDWLERERWSVPVIVDPDNRVADAYGLSAFPYFVLIDAQGRVIGRATGELPIEDLEQIVTQLGGA